MTIRREDLLAAAAVGILQYRQVEPLLVFLLQRDVHAQREAMLARQHRQSVSRQRTNTVLSKFVGILALVTASLFAVLFFSSILQAMPLTAVLLFSLVYVTGGVAAANWMRYRGFCKEVRVTAALAIVSVPLAAIALQYVPV